MMKQTGFTPRRAAALLLTAAALPLTAAFAQEAQVPDPIVDVAPPPAIPQPVETVPPVQTQTIAPAPVTTAPEPAAATPAETTAAPRRTARTVTRTPARTAAPARAAPARAAAPAPVAAAPVLAETPAPAPAAEATPPPAVLPAAPAAAPAEQQTSGGSNLLWVVLGALALGALAVFFLLRRRRSAAYDEADGRAYAPAAAVPVAAVPVAESAPADAGRPELDLDLRPRRAGVSGDEAVVEFELDVANRGSAAARDVRVSTWMIPAGSQTEMERALIERPEGEAVAEIEAGSGECIARSVTLDTRGVEGDAVLPVVVAEARYTLPDGTEARTSASYAVGVPDGEELAYFAIDNPSGLHEEVVAKALGETERA